MLDKKLAVTPILSSSFDSLWRDVQKLPPRQQAAILLRISCRDEKETGGIQKQERILLESLPFISKKEKKKILLRLLSLYKRLSEQREPDADAKGIQLCENLETTYSFSQEEKWGIKRIKAFLLGRRGLYKQYLPIWFELLSEHRAAGRPELVIDDLFAIANHSIILGDQEKGISLYEEANQLAIDNHLIDLSNQCLSVLIKLFTDYKQYAEIVNYINKINIDSLVSSIPSVYPLLSRCYLELQKPDSARLYLTKIDQTQKIGNGMIINCNIANTYIAEHKIDSALIFLNKAMRQFQNQAERLQKNNIKASLPFYFLPTCSSLATLYQQSGDYQKAGKSFLLVEPLMKKAAKDLSRMEKQVDALARYSSFCRATKQYEKAVDLLMFRDSLLQIINKADKERESKNFISRLQISDLEHQNKLQETSLANSHRMVVVSTTCAILFFFLICAVGYICYQRKKRLDVIMKQEKEAEQLESSATPEKEKSLTPEEKLYHAAYEKVRLQKLYLNKDIRLKSLAEMLKTNHTYLSSCINTCYGNNYNQWINDFRIDYLLGRIHSGKKLSDLAEEAGFASTDAFYRNFKRKTGLTPNEYLKQHPKKQNPEETVLC
ncbi:hypothetical protein HMPREF1076_03714 [Parabacteroides goldsteinii CL02T12C30]|uniref:HTH araC/xylS-type domain-containing protein n=2 Tax=Parabacteroides goldsteinii TaxID=328812 RepID=K5YBZ5_9BACT|nr:hypothetical protein HMPREF1076_03714 [Parabacteroides goldsteinii CL02T12C30]